MSKTKSKEAPSHTGFLNLNNFKSLVNRLAMRYSHYNVFSDFLEISIAALSGGRMETEYEEVVKKYSTEEKMIYSELFAEMINIMNGDGEGYVDCLGEYFMQEITRGQNGQFFTPQPVTDMMALMTATQGMENKTICDPAAGSGRTLLAAAKHTSKNNLFFAADLDIICAKMCAINFCLNGLRGEVAWMDTLAYDLFRAYEIFYDPTRLFVPTIRILEKEQSVFYSRREQIIPAQEQKIKHKGSTDVLQLQLF